MKNNKNKNGFTLIELLVTIALMLSILALAIISITKVNDRFKERSFESVKDEVITAAKEYFNVNTYYLEPLGPQNASATVKVSIGELVNNDYLNSVTNPITGKKLNYCDYVLVEKKDKKLTYTYKEDSTTDPSSCNVHSYVEVTPAPNLGTIEKEYIGKIGNEYDGKQWYKRNSTVEYDTGKISPGVVVKLTANLKGSDYRVLAMEVNGKKLPIVEDKDGKTTYDTVYDTLSYGTSVTDAKTTKYTVTYINDEDDSILTRHVYINDLYVDIDPPSCKITVLGAKKDNDTYYCYTANLLNRLTFILPEIEFNPKVIYTYTDNESGATVPIKIDELTPGMTLLSSDVYDHAGNENKCSRNVKTEELDSSSLLGGAVDTIVDIFKDSKYYCAETIGEPSANNWTNKDRTITQYFRNNSGSEEKKTITFKTTQKTGEITRDIISGPSCAVNVYVDKTPPQFYRVDTNSFQLIQYDTNGKTIYQSKLNVTCNGNVCNTQLCLKDKKGAMEIRYDAVATDSHSGVNQGTWIMDWNINTRVHKNYSWCSNKESPCDETWIKKVSDNAGNQGTIVTLNAKVGYERIDSFCK